MSHRILVGVLSLVVLATGCGEPCAPAPEGTLGQPTTWEQRFLAEQGLPIVATRDTLAADDGLALAYADWVPSEWSGAEPMVLLVHGSTAYGDLYSVLGQGLAARGVLARLIDVRGHGRSACPTPTCDDPEAPRAYVDDGDYWPGRPGDSLDANQIARDLHAMVVDLQQQWPQAPLYIAGHSSGAGAVARYVEQTGMAHLEGAIVLTPFFHPDQPQNQLETWDCGRASGTGYARVDLGALGDALRGNPHRYVLSFHKDPEFTAQLDTLHYSHTTTLGMAATNADDFFASFVRPVLWVAAEHDALLDLSASRAEFARLPAGGAFVVANDTSHVGVSWSGSVAALMAEFVHDPAAVEDGSIEPP